MVFVLFGRVVSYSWVVAGLMTNHFRGPSRSGKDPCLFFYLEPLHWVSLVLGLPLHVISAMDLRRASGT